LAIFPVLVNWLQQIRAMGGRAVVTSVAVLAVLAYVQWVAKWSLPWIPHLILSEFATERVAIMSSPGFKSFALPLPAAILFSVPVLAAAMAFAAIAWTRLRHSLTSNRNALGDVFSWLCIPYALAYLALLLPRASLAFVLDRYLLGLMPIAIICLIRLYQEWIAPRLPMSCFLALAIYALLAVAGTHDWFAWQRARLEAIREVQATGVPRTEIQGGFEYDGWTQLETVGFINDRWIVNPPDSYQTHPAVPQVAGDCALDFAPYTPTVRPKYSVVFGLEPCLAPSTYPPVSYHAWIPPFRRQVSVQKIPISPATSERVTP
jgi:hypothetical protein